MILYGQRKSSNRAIVEDGTQDQPAESILQVAAGKHD
jgi:hypothetical protein